MAEIPLFKLNSRYSTNPAQPIIANADTATVDEAAPTLIDVGANDYWLQSRGATVTATSSLVNCTATPVGSRVLMTGTAPGAASFSYTISDGVTQATTTLSAAVASVTARLNQTRAVDIALPSETLRTFTVLPRFSDTTLMLGQLVHVNHVIDSTFPGVTDPFTELSFVVDWGDAGSASETLPVDFFWSRSFERSMGPYAAHFYDTAGDKTITVHVSKTVAGVVTAFGTYQTTLKIVDPWAANTPSNPHPYLDANTYVIAGGADTSGINPAWTVYQTLENLFQNVSMASGSGPNIRIGFMRGVEHVSGPHAYAPLAINVPVRIRNRDTYVGALGAGARPKITVAHYRPLPVFDLYQGARFTMHEIDCEGQYDPVTGTGAGYACRLVSNNGCNRVSITRGVTKGVAMTCRNDNGAVPTGQVMTVIGYGDYQVRDYYDYGLGLQPEARWEKGILLGCSSVPKPGTVTGPGGKDLSITTGEVVTAGGAGESFTLDLPANYLAPELFDATSIVVYQWDDAYGFNKTILNSGADGFTVTATGVGTGANGTGRAVVTWPAGTAAGRHLEVSHVAWADHSAYRSPSDYESVYSQCSMANDSGWSTPPEGKQSGIRLVQGGASPNQNMVGMSFCMNQCDIIKGFHVFSMQAANTSQIRVDELKGLVEACRFIGGPETWDMVNNSYTGVTFRNIISVQTPNSTSVNNAHNSVFSLGYGVNLSGGTNGTGTIRMLGITALQLQPDSGVPPGNGTDWALFEYAGGAASNLYNADIQDARNLLYALDATPVDSRTRAPVAAWATDPLLDVDYVPQTGSRALDNIALDETSPYLWEDAHGAVRFKQVDGAILP